jgi:hypothetical protein
VHTRAAGGDSIWPSLTAGPTFPSAPDQFHKHSSRPAFFQHLPKAFRAGHEDWFGEQRKTSYQARLSAIQNTANQFLFVNGPGNVNTRLGAGIQNPERLAHECSFQLKVDVAVEYFHASIQVSLAPKFAVVLPGKRGDARLVAVNGSSKKGLIVYFLAGVAFNERPIEL